jgi:hypothetical protein
VIEHLSDDALATARDLTAIFEANWHRDLNDPAAPRVPTLDVRRLLAVVIP